MSLRHSPIANLLKRDFFVCVGPIHTVISGVETGRPGGSTNRGPAAPGGPECGHGKFYKKMCEMTHLHSTLRVFNSRRGHLRSQKATNPWRLRDPLGELTSLPRPGSRPSPKPHLRSQHFGLPASAGPRAETTEGPQVTVELGPLQSMDTPLTVMQQLTRVQLHDTRRSRASILSTFMEPTHGTLDNNSGRKIAVLELLTFSIHLTLTMQSCDRIVMIFLSGTTTSR